MSRQLRTIAFYTLLEALRNRLIWLFAVVAVIGVGLSGFLNELAITESRQLQAALLAAFLRFAAVFLVATFVVTSMMREFNDKGADLLLALALPRAGYLLGKLLGFGALALIPAILFGVLIGLLAPIDQALLWSLSLVCELWLVAAASLLCVFTFSQILPALSAVMGFYLLGRSIGALQLMGHNPLNGNSGSQQVINFVIDSIAVMMPRLDQFTRTEWLVYQTGDWNAALPLLAQTAIYLLLLTGMALFDLYRKNF
jgi:ABC-type transport system involved in multi-copper enzyme maturation permease subunit